MRDIAKDTFIGNLPHWLRWILFLPAAVIQPVIIYVIVITLMSYFNQDDTQIIPFMVELFCDVLLVGSFIMSGTFVAPKGQAKIAVILLFVWITIDLISFLLGFLNPLIYPRLLMLHISIRILSGVIFVYYLRRKLLENR